ncbi:MAG TPA: response regulator [Rhizobiaceae bacterium]
MKALGDLICIIDDDTSFRGAITRLLELRGYDVAAYGSANQFLRALCDGLEPACILLDMKMPGLSGPGLQAHLSQLGLSFPIIFVTGHGDVPTTVRAIKEGAEDVLTKPVAEQALTQGIRRALAHSRADQARREWLKEARAQLETLTPREREVFDYVVRGKMNKQTAHDLGITERTIKAHRHRIFEKFGAKTVADLVSLAERLGMLTELNAPLPK